MKIMTFEEIRLERDELQKRLQNLLLQKTSFEDYKICRELCIEVSRINSGFKLLDVQEEMYKMFKCNHVYIVTSKPPVHDVDRYGEESYGCVKCGLDTRIFTDDIREPFNIVHPTDVQQIYFETLRNSVNLEGVKCNLNKSMEIWRQIKEHNPGISDDEAIIILTETIERLNRESNNPVRRK